MCIVLCGCRGQSWICNLCYIPDMWRQMLDVVFGGPADIWLFSWPIFHNHFLGRQPPLLSVIVTLVASTGFCHLQRLPMNQCQCCMLSCHTCIHPCSVVGGSLCTWPQWQAHHRVDPWGCIHLPSCVHGPASIDGVGVGVWTWMGHQLLREHHCFTPCSAL